MEPLEAVSLHGRVDAEVIEALTALGYSIVEAQSSIAIPGKTREGDAEARFAESVYSFLAR